MKPAGQAVLSPSLSQSQRGKREGAKSVVETPLDDHLPAIPLPPHEPRSSGRESAHFISDPIDQSRLTSAATIQRFKARNFI